MIAFLLGLLLAVPIPDDASFLLVGETPRTEKEAAKIVVRRQNQKIPTSAVRGELFVDLPAARIAILYGAFADKTAAQAAAAKLRKAGVKVQLKKAALKNSEQRLMRVWGQLGDVIMHPTEVEIRTADDTVVVQTDKDGWYQGWVRVLADTGGQISLKAALYPSPKYDATICSKWSDQQGTEAYQANTSDLPVRLVADG